MISASHLNRQTARHHWLANHFGHRNFAIETASADASFRQYFRVRSNQKSFILMDAPPDLEDCQPFITVQDMLFKHGIHVPEVFAQDLDSGFLLLSDFGSTLYLDILADDNAERLYQQAIDALLQLQLTPQTQPLPDYSQHLLNTEMCLFDDWFIAEHLGHELSDSEQQTLEKTRQWLIGHALEQPQVMVHRDYHSRNLMVTDNSNPGIIDFQDAVQGPFSYDLASLLNDCYIAWPQERVDSLCQYFLTRYNQLHHDNIELNAFKKWFELMAAQRQLKAIGIFCRLNYRDGKKQYLNDVPRTLNYLSSTAQKYPELDDFSALLARLQPKLSVV